MWASPKRWGNGSATEGRATLWPALQPQEVIDWQRGARIGSANHPEPQGGSQLNNPFVGFVPWIIFWVFASPASWEYAALAALIAAIVLALPDARGHKLKVLDITTIVFFGVFAVLAIFLDRADLDWLEDYSQAISSGVLALIVLGSLAFVPFTEQYARETAPPEVQATPLFKQINRTLTLVWGLVFLAAAILGVIAQELDSGSEWLNVIIPVALIAMAFRFTQRYPDDARAKAGLPPRAAA